MATYFAGSICKRGIFSCCAVFYESERKVKIILTLRYTLIIYNHVQTYNKKKLRNTEFISYLKCNYFKGCNFMCQKEFEESPKPLGFSIREATKLLFGELLHCLFFPFLFVLFLFSSPRLLLEPGD